MPSSMTCRTAGIQIWNTLSQLSSSKSGSASSFCARNRHCRIGRLAVWLRCTAFGCRACQGKGYGRAGANLAISWVQRERPGVNRLMLAVNTRNVIAKSVYLKAGFVDTGEIFRGPIGDQNILTIEIPRRGG
jgi:hypothetical protein